jgi:hypothetical protein
MTCPSAATISQLLEGALAEPARITIERHLDGCAACGELVSELAWVVAPPRTAPPRFRLVRELAGVAWLADDLERDEPVELVFVSGRSPILRTAQIWRELAHPGLVEIVDAGTHGDETYVATRIVEGPTEIAPSALDAVAALHRAGGVHGSLGPEVITRTLVGGLGRPNDPAYRAPEVLHGATSSAASDQFALCVVLWEARVGRRPFAGATPGALAVAMQSPLTAPGSLAPHVFAALRRGLDPDPAKRWPDLAALAAALERPTTRRWPYAILALAAIAITFGVVLAML